MAHNAINKIVRDSRGFLWFCTDEGLSRLDGYAFTNYGVGEGLPPGRIMDLAETHDGELWLATAGGLVRFNPKGKPRNRVVYDNEAGDGPVPMFTVVTPVDEDRYARSFTRLLEGRDGTIWCGTLKGLYRLERANGRLELHTVDLKFPNESRDQRFVYDLAEDKHDSLWIAAASGLYRRLRDGSTARYIKRDGLPSEYIQDLLADHLGQMWAATRDGGFFRFVTDDQRAPPLVAEAYLNFNPGGGSIKWVYQLFETSDGRFWVATNNGIAEFNPTVSEGRKFTAYTTRNGLSLNEITALNEDASGNLWLGSYVGAMKLAREGFVTYDEQDSLLGVNAIFGDRAGGVCFRGWVAGDESKSVFEGAKPDLLRPLSGSHPRFGRFDGKRFAWFKPEAARIRNFGWMGEAVTLQARNGEWWLGTGEGLYRFPAADDFTRIKRARPLAVYQTKLGLTAHQQVYKVFEDSRGDIWASTAAAPNGLARWDRATGIFFRDLAESPGLPSSSDDLAQSFGEDASGNVWIGFIGGLARYRQGRFTFFSANDGLPQGSIRYIYSDRAGRLWLATSRGGLVRVNNVDAERPSFTIFGVAQGLSSNSTTVITEDLQGRIYVATGRGVDQLDLERGRVRRFTTADGLAGGDVIAAFRDGGGAVWFGLRKGLSRLEPAPETLAPALPPVLITALSVAGERQAVSALGETEVTLPDIAADRNQLQMDFVGLSFAPGESLRYQYRLEGADADWGTPTEQRTMNYARLAAGDYKLFVRAVASDGSVSAVPAVVQFRVLPHIWQRWWFSALTMLLVVALSYFAYRIRVTRLAELERVRTRIATDLHDDVGAGLSRIAVLSEVARHEAGNSSVTERLSTIATASRELVGSMSDIVWLTNPDRDHLRDLVQRMRRFASDLFTSRGIEFTFRAPTNEGELRVSADTRRHIFLIFKEGVNNIVSHSGSTEAAIELKVEGGSFALTVSDKGHGFDPARAGDGNGLANMHERARVLGGELRITTDEGGTTVTVCAPLKATIKERNGRMRGPGA